MKNYRISIEETVVDEFEITAKNSKEALDIIRTKYHNGEITLSPGEVQFKRMSIMYPLSERTELEEI